MQSRLESGDVILVAFPTHQPRGREQQGKRPALVVAVPSGITRYPILLIAPLTTQSGDWVEQNSLLYVRLDVGEGGLTKSSIVLLDQVRAIDARRVLAYLGSLTPERYQQNSINLQRLFSV